jgi:hypothetical protein
MQSIFELIEKIGLFALAVIAVCVGLMLLISLLDRHPRRKSSTKRDNPRQ